MNTNKRICPSCDRVLPETAFGDRARACRVCTAIHIARARKFPRNHAETINRVLVKLNVRQLLDARRTVRKAA